MTTRKQNPLGFEKPEGVIESPAKKKRRKRGRKKPITKKQRQSIIDEFNYRDRVKRMRGLFGDQFKPADGYDLRKFNDWTPAQKAKVTRYFRVIAPRITGDFVVKRYRRPDNLQAAIGASLQEKRLAGQTAAVFSVDPKEELNLKVRRGRVKVIRDGLVEHKLIFDRMAFLQDPEAEISRVLEETDANVFRIIVGAQKKNEAISREQVMEKIFSLIARYSDDNLEEGERPWEEWLNGLIAYPGTKKRTLTKVQKLVKKHKAITAQRQRERLNEFSRRRRAYTRRELMRGRR